MEGEESPMSKMEATVKAVFAKKLFGRRRRDPLPLPERPRHIAVLLPADVGDVVCLSGMVKPLRMAQPQAQITAICLPKAAEAARLTDQYDRVVQLDPHGPDLHDHVLRVLPDLLVDLTYMCDFPQVIKDTCYEKISVICPILGMLGDGEHGLIDHVVDGSPYDHILHNAAKMLRRYDAQLTKLPTLELPSWARKWEVCQEYGNYLVIDPWLIRSAEKFQAWSEEKWAELMAIMPELKMNVLLLGGGHEKEYMARFAQHMQGRISAGGQIRHKVVDFTGQLTLHETAAFLFHSKGYVGVNGALGHVAAALDVPSVLLLTGQTDMQRGPLSVFSKVVMPPVGHPYIADISSRQVAEAVLEILKGWCFQGE
jgi:ADP-heptose:LPS heptosyltransferase